MKCTLQGHMSVSCQSAKKRSMARKQQEVTRDKQRSREGRCARELGSDDDDERSFVCVCVLVEAIFFLIGQCGDVEQMANECDCGSVSYNSPLPMTLSSS